MIVFLSWLVDQNLSAGEAPAAEADLRFVRVCQKENRATLLGLTVGNSRQAFITPLHPEMVQVNADQLRPEFAPPGDDQIYSRSPGSSLDTCMDR